MKLKDLKITYNTLCDLDFPVPNELLVHLAGQIRSSETRTEERKKARMTEEQLIRLDSKQKRVLRIYTADGRMVHRDSADDTFREAVSLLDSDALASIDFRMGRKPVILRDPTLSRRRFRNYYFLRPGFFLLAVKTSADKYNLLRRIDAHLHLNWDIELV